MADEPKPEETTEEKIARFERLGKLVLQAIAALFVAGAATVVVGIGAWQQIREAQSHLKEKVVDVTKTADTLAEKVTDVKKDVDKVETKVAQVDEHTTAVDKVAQENAKRLTAAGAQ
jgi:septal ring factor EnvC (AmiA/AmiB activator)